MDADGNSAADPDADLESHPSDAPLRENESPAFNSLVRLTFYHTRKRLIDIDGLSVKAAIDGLVQGNILADDSSQQVAEISHIQIKGKPEETRIVIEEIDLPGEEWFDFGGEEGT